MEATEAPDLRAGLLDTIRARRAGIEAYVRRKAPVSRRLSTVSILSSAVIVALMAGPALGGPTFAERVQEGLSLGTTQPVWQVLCFAALVVSMTAAVSAHLEKTSDLRARVGAAEAAGVMLAGLQARLEYGGLAVQEDAQEYRDVLAGIPFVPEVQGGTTSSPGRREHGPALDVTVDGRLQLSSPSGASLTGDLGDRAISGELRTPSLSTSFTATVAEEPAGVYEARIQVNGTPARIGWAVLPDGSQVGVTTVGDTRSAAPELELTDLTFMHNGGLFTARSLGP